jgi:hypothetical protein
MPIEGREKEVRIGRVCKVWSDSRGSELVIEVVKQAKVHVRVLNPSRFGRDHDWLHVHILKPAIRDQIIKAI